MSYNRNFFDSLEGGGSGDDWNIDELDEIQRMLESDGSDMPLPEEQSAESPEEQPAETAGKARSATYTMLSGSRFLLEEMQKRLDEPGDDVAGRLRALKRQLEPEDDGFRDVE